MQSSCYIGREREKLATDSNLDWIYLLNYLDCLDNDLILVTKDAIVNVILIIVIM